MGEYEVQLTEGRMRGYGQGASGKVVGDELRNISVCEGRE